MSTIPHEKLTQAAGLMPQFDLDCWLLLGRETGELCDPSLPLLMEAAITRTVTVFDEMPELLSTVRSTSQRDGPLRRGYSGSCGSLGCDCRCGRLS